jgi:PAS domain S-box-containing protein
MQSMNKKPIHILLVEAPGIHASNIREGLETSLRKVNITTTQSLAEAHNCLNESFPDLTITDLLLPDGKGIELLSDNPEEAPCPILIMADDREARTAVTAIRAGAFDYIVKPDTTLSDWPDIVKRTLDKWAGIAERRQAEQALRESNDRLSSFFESSVTGMAILSPEGKVLKVNPTFCRLSGYSEAETLGKNALEVTHPDDREETRRLYEEILIGRRRVVDHEKRYLCKDGSTRWGHTTIAGVFAADGTLNCFAANVQDISESKRIRDEIRESKRMLQLILDYIPQYVFWKDRDSVYRGCNRSFARLAGKANPQELIGKTDHDLPWPRDETDFFRECDRRVMETDVPELHSVEPHFQTSGRQAWFDKNKIPLHNSRGEVTGILGTIEDITERKRAEEKLLEANRELDAFAHTVSHDLRTPLTPIIGYAEALQDLCRDQLDEQSLSCLAEIESQGRKMLALLEDLLLLAKVGHLPRPTEAVDLNKMVDELLLEMGSLIAENGIVIEKTSLPELRIPKTLLEQIFGNLIGNAIRYAGRDGNPLEIGGERNGDRVRLYVRDHGPGIEQEESSRIFEVFYRGTASKKSPGTGIGLATVQKISRLYMGKAWVEETAGGGSTFLVELQDGPNTHD